MKAFLITTQYNELTRWEHAKRELSACGISYFPILATDWRMYEHTTLSPAQYKHQSLTLAYYQACQTAVFLGLKEFMIFEDDILVKDRLELYHVIHNPPKYFDICFLTRTEHNKIAAETIPYDSAYDLIKGNWWETPATMWSEKFARTFIHHIHSKLHGQLWLGHIDDIINDFIKAGAGYFFGAKAQTIIGLSNTEQDIISREGSISQR